MYKPLDDTELFNSYKAYEANVEKQVKSGILKPEDARKYLTKAKDSYRRKNYNREMDRINAS